MYNSKRNPKIKATLGFILFLLTTPALVAGIRYLLSIDPFARYSAAYANPLGAGIGSVITDANVTVFEGNEKILAFDVSRIEIHRNQQYFLLRDVHDGIVWDKGKEKAKFRAGDASYDSRKEFVEVRGSPKLVFEEGELSASVVEIFRNEKRMVVTEGVDGTYKKGEIHAASLIYDWENRYGIVEGFSWKGPIEFPQEKTVKRRLILVRGERFESFTNPDRVVFYYNAEAIDQDSLLRARKITHDRENDIIVAEGECEYHAPDAFMLAPKVTIYNKEKRAVITGDVRLTIKPEKEKGRLPSSVLQPAKPNLPPGVKSTEKLSSEEQKKTEEELRSGKTVRKYPIVITCRNIEYFYQKGSKRAIITGSPVARQELRNNAWREITGPRAIYEEEKEILTLKSTPGMREVVMKNSLGDEFHVETLVISTKEGDERITGYGAEGSLRLREEEIGGETPGARKEGGGKGGGKKE